MIIVSLINSAIYYTLSTWINGTPENILSLLLTSFIGKTIALICSLGALFLINKIEKIIKLRSKTKKI
jgi:hypothetical protein